MDRWALHTNGQAAACNLWTYDASQAGEGYGYADCSQAGEGWDQAGGFYSCTPGEDTLGGGSAGMMGWSLAAESRSQAGPFTVRAEVELSSMESTASLFYLKVGSAMHAVGLDGSSAETLSTLAENNFGDRGDSELGAVNTGGALSTGTYTLANGYQCELAGWVSTRDYAKGWVRIKTEAIKPATCSGVGYTFSQNSFRGDEQDCLDSAGTCANAVPDVPGTTTKALCLAAPDPAKRGTFTSTATYVAAISYPDATATVSGLAPGASYDFALYQYAGAPHPQFGGENTVLVNGFAKASTQSDSEAPSLTGTATATAAGEIIFTFVETCTPDDLGGRDGRGAGEHHCTGGFSGFPGTCTEAAAASNPADKAACQAVTDPLDATACDAVTRAADGGAGACAWAAKLGNRVHLSGIAVAKRPTAAVAPALFGASGAASPGATAGLAGDTFGLPSEAFGALSTFGASPVAANKKFRMTVSRDASDALALWVDGVRTAFAKTLAGTVTEVGFRPHRGSIKLYSMSLTDGASECRDLESHFNDGPLAAGLDPVDPVNKCQDCGSGNYQCPNDTPSLDCGAWCASTASCEYFLVYDTGAKRGRCCRGAGLPAITAAMPADASLYKMRATAGALGKASLTIGSCTETAAVSDPADKAACEAVTALLDATACDAVELSPGGVTAQYIRIDLTTGDLVINLRRLIAYDTAGSAITADDVLTTSSGHEATRPVTNLNHGATDTDWTVGNSAGTNFHSDGAGAKWAIVGFSSPVEIAKVEVYNRDTGARIVGATIKLCADTACSDERWSGTFGSAVEVYTFVTNMDTDGNDSDGNGYDAEARGSACTWAAGSAPRTLGETNDAAADCVACPTGKFVKETGSDTLGDCTFCAADHCSPHINRTAEQPSNCVEFWTVPSIAEPLAAAAVPSKSVLGEAWASCDAAALTCANAHDTRVGPYRSFLPTLPCADVGSSDYTCGTPLKATTTIDRDVASLPADFAPTFAASLASWAGVDKARVFISGVVSGSSVVSFEIAPPAVIAATETTPLATAAISLLQTWRDTDGAGAAVAGITVSSDSVVDLSLDSLRTVCRESI